MYKYYIYIKNKYIKNIESILINNIKLIFIIINK